MLFCCVKSRMDIGNDLEEGEVIDDSDNEEEGKNKVSE